MAVKEDTIGYIVTLDLQQGKLDALQRAADEAVQIARNNEPGTIDYRWYLTPDGKQVRIHVRFEGSKGMVAHLQGRGVQEVLPQKILKVSKIHEIEVFGQVSPEARRILDGMNAVYSKPLAGFSRMHAEATVHPIAR